MFREKKRVHILLAKIGGSSSVTRFERRARTIFKLRRNTEKWNIKILSKEGTLFDSDLLVVIVR